MLHIAEKQLSYWCLDPKWVSEMRYWNMKFNPNYGVEAINWEVKAPEDLIPKVPCFPGEAVCPEQMPYCMTATVTDVNPKNPIYAASIKGKDPECMSKGQSCNYCATGQMKMWSKMYKGGWTDWGVKYKLDMHKTHMMKDIRCTPKGEGCPDTHACFRRYIDRTDMSNKYIKAWSKLDPTLNQGRTAHMCVPGQWIKKMMGMNRKWISEYGYMATYTRVGPMPKRNRRGDNMRDEKMEKMAKKVFKKMAAKDDQIERLKRRVSMRDGAATLAAGAAAALALATQI